MTKTKCLGNMIVGICIVISGLYLLKYCWSQDSLIYRNILTLFLVSLIPLYGALMIIAAIPTYFEEQKMLKEKQAKEEEERIRKEENRKFNKELQRQQQEEAKERREARQREKDLKKERERLQKEKDEKKRMELQSYTDSKLQLLLQTAHRLNNTEEHSYIGKELYRRYNALVDSIKNCENDDEIKNIKDKLDILEPILDEYNEYESILRERERQREEYEYQLQQAIEEYHENERRKWKEEQREFEYRERLRDMEKTNKEFRNSVATTFNNINNTLSNMEKESKRTNLNPYDRQKLKDAVRTVQSEMKKYK